MAAALRADPDTELWCREKGDAYDARELRRIWIKATVHRSKLIIDAADPLAAARLYHARESSTLQYHRDNFYEFAGCCYPELELSELRARLYVFLEGASTVSTKGTRPFKPNMVRVANVLDALRAVAHLPAVIDRRLGSARPAALRPRTSSRARTDSCIYQR
jgi:hypothetical protein